MGKRQIANRRWGRRKTGDYYDALRARFSGDEAPRVEPSFRAPPDPSTKYFGAGPADEAQTTEKLFDPLGAKDEARALGAAINAFARREARLLTHAARLLIGLVWALAAGWFFMREGSADAQALGQLFLVLGAAGIGAAIAGALVTIVVPGATVKRITGDGAALGQRLAFEARAADAARRTGLSAVEAEAFRSATAFMSAAPAGEDAAAQEGFAAYLGRPAKKRANRAGALFVAALVIVIASIVAVLAAPAMAPEGSIVAAYPILFAMIVVSALLYAGAGAISAAGGAGFIEKSAAAAEARAFAACRKGFAASGAGANGTPASAMADQTHAAREDHASLEAAPTASDAAAIRPNRSGDSGPIFVETGFQAAPKTFRTDAFEKNFRRK
ncbi:MAG: hypothetical protein AAFW81_03440 [Pseudomonadota bacterium]